MNLYCSSSASSSASSLEFLSLRPCFTAARIEYEVLCRKVPGVSRSDSNREVAVLTVVSFQVVFYLRLLVIGLP